MSAPTVQEPLRDRVGRAIFEAPGVDHSWYVLSEERREPWREDADRAIAVVHADQTATSKSVAPPQVHGDVIEALTQAEEYFENLSDVSDGDYGEPRPNREMAMAQLCRDALEKVALKSDLEPITCLKEQIDIDEPIVGPVDLAHQPGPQMDALDEAIGHLSAAALQISPKDDQIIADHIRDSVALLLQHRHKLREAIA